MSITDKRILVVDDFSTMRRMIKNVLKEIDFTNVAEADNGENGWKVLESEEIELVISDWNMPVMSGIELLERVRDSDKFKELPFIMVTAEGQKENVIMAIKKGVTSYIVKPFSAEALEEKIYAAFDMEPEE